MEMSTIEAVLLRHSLASKIHVYVFLLALLHYSTAVIPVLQIIIYVKKLLYKIQHILIYFIICNNIMTLLHKGSFDFI